MKGKFTGDLHFGSLHAFLFGDSTIEGDGFHVEDDIGKALFIKPIWAAKVVVAHSVARLCLHRDLDAPFDRGDIGDVAAKVACPVAVPKMSSFGALLVNLNLPLNAPASA